MKKLFKFISVIALSLGIAFAVTGCGEDPIEPSPQVEFIDYASQLKLDLNSNTAKIEGTVKTFIDGDTTHFKVASDQFEDHTLKARYLAINTPESTGRIDEYGKQASNFTKSKLSQAVSIIIESDDGNWNKDSSGGRILSWIWYKPAPEADYINLNLEILQNGYAKASATLQNRYGEICFAALNQAKGFKLKLYSGEKDPEYYYGEAVELTLKELRINIADYNGMKVAFEGNITKNYDNSIYIEEYDEETGIYYGMVIYLGYSANGEILKRTKTGYRVRMAGSVQYYEAGGTYQISDVQYKTMEPDNPLNVQKLGEGYVGAYPIVSAETFNSKIKVLVGDEYKEYDYGFLTMNTTIQFEDLDVSEVYTTTTSSSNGAMTLTCFDRFGNKIIVRTVPLLDENNKLITADAYEGKNITVKGHVDCFSGEYQIKIFAAKDIVVNN